MPLFLAVSLRREATDTRNGRDLRRGTVTDRVLHGFQNDRQGQKGGIQSPVSNILDQCFGLGFANAEVSVGKAAGQPFQQLWQQIGPDGVDEPHP